MVSFICPVYNEEAYIEDLIDFYRNLDINEKELLIVDGGSTDSTVEIVKNARNNASTIKLLNNEQKYVPFALNIALSKSKGDPIIRLDAHTKYRDDYADKILETFQKTNADIVGGPMRAIGSSPFQEAVAYATSTKFGIGDSKIHDQKFEGYTDHVYLGSWRRSLFNDIGYFDERLKRNQDDEFHYRASSMGKKIYLNPEIYSEYYPRDSVFRLSKQYFQYGFYKPLVLSKIKSETKLRHLIPSIFVVYLGLIPIFLSYNLLFFLPLFLYFLIDLYFAFLNKKSLLTKIHSVGIYPIIHISYGSGFLIGALKLILNMFKQLRMKLSI